MRKSTSGFTIVELLTVIIVIVILATISYMTYARFQIQSRDNKRQSDIALLQSQLERYYQKNNEYPGSCPSALPASCTSYSSGVQIQLNQSLANLDSIMPGLDVNFGDPLRLSSGSYFNDLSNPSYYYIGGLYSNVNSSVTFSWPGTSVTCNYSLTLAAGQQSSYIIAYYNELNKKPVFLKGQRGVQFTWPQNAVSQPNCVTS